MGKIAFVFPGQGAQYSGMGRDLFLGNTAARGIFEQADVLRLGTSSQCFLGTKEELAMTQNTQPCLYCVELAAASALVEEGVRPDMLAGFSLGEVAAVCFSGAVGFENGFKLVCRRGELMQKASESADSTMAAVLKLDDSTVESICRKYAEVYPVNYNCPGQLVVAGRKEALAALQDDVANAGGKTLFLNVSGGFHSPFMRQAAVLFTDVLRDIRFSTVKTPLYSNYTAKPYGDDVAQLLARQMENPVRWQQTIENMIVDGADTFIEVGAKKILCGLISKISDAVKTYHVEDMESLHKTVLEVKQHA